MNHPACPEEDPMTTLPTCPREDCTASERHYHGSAARKCCADLYYCQRNHFEDNTVSPCYAPRTPQPQPAAVVLPTVDEAARVIPEAWANPSSVGSVHLIAAQAVLDLLTTRLPVWQPVEPGAVIKAGPLYRIEWGADDTEGRSAVERTYAGDFTIDPTDPGRYYVDPRTVPAEPEDPRVAVVAKAMSDALDDNGVTTCDWTAEARDILAKLDGFDR